MSLVRDAIDIFLEPGELFVGDAMYRVRTLLGSCVSVTLWHPPTCFGAMSHFLLPTRGSPVRPSDHDGRYGDEALQLIVQSLERAGVPPAECQAKIFGGGNMFPGQMQPGNVQIGQRNGEAARAMLRAAGIAVVSESLFGVGHRQIIFDLCNGDVWSYQARLADADLDSGETLTWPASR